MESVNKTLYIPLWAKAQATRQGILLHDLMAVTIWDLEGFQGKRKAGSKWLAWFLAMRARVFDDWTRGQLAQCPDALVLHIGCGLDSRCLRVGGGNWVDIDLPGVIEKRRAYFPESEGYSLLAADASRSGWVAELPDARRAVVILEGVSMYLPRSRVTALLKALRAKYPELRVLMDVYTTLGARASRLRNPVKKLGVNRFYGIDDPRELRALQFVQEHTMTPDHCIAQLRGLERWFFRAVFAGSIAGKLHRLLELREP